MFPRRLNPTSSRSPPACSRMGSGGRGRIINIASTHGLVASTPRAAYVAAKHEVLGLTTVAALETATTGVTCNAIRPCCVLTPLVEERAGGKPVTALPGASTFDSAMSFGLIRGGHLDRTVLGGLQVDRHGRLANWMVPGKMVPGMGGAMDLVSGAKRVIVAMQHTAKGRPKIVRECSLPLTSDRPVDLVVTELGVIGFPDGRATLLETQEGGTVDEVLAGTEADLAISPELIKPAIPNAASGAVAMLSMGETK